MPAVNPFDPSDFRIEPIERAFTIPSSWYTDERIHEFEIRHLFPRFWQYAGPADVLPETGDHKPVTSAGTPCLLVRDEAGGLRAYYNVCKHRGGPIATCEGRSKMLKCSYHGWTYRLDGSLRGVPHFRHAELFDKGEFGLTPVELEQWEGMLFLRSEAGPVGLDELLKGIREHIHPVRLPEMGFRKRVVYDVKCNWKAYVDNYLEGYHIPHVHPELCDLLTLQDYRTEVFPWYSLQYSPLQARENIYTAAGSRKSTDMPQKETTGNGTHRQGYHDEGGQGQGQGQGQTQGQTQAWYYFIFPNMMLNILPGRLQVNLVEPVTASTCRVIFDYYYAHPGHPETDKLLEADMAFSDDVQREEVLG
jgi:choline monooxygenase